MLESDPYEDDDFRDWRLGELATTYRSADERTLIDRLNEEHVRYLGARVPARSQQATRAFTQ